MELWKGEVTATNLYRQVRVLPDEQNITVVVGDLEKFGHYNVTVLCFTSPGDGPRSAPVEAVTFEDRKFCVAKFWSHIGPVRV